MKELNVKGEEEEEVRNRARVLRYVLSVRYVILSALCDIVQNM